MINNKKKRTMFKAILIEKSDQGNVIFHNISKFRNCTFLCSDEEYCYNLQGHINNMLDNEIDEIQLYLCKREIDSPYFFCKYYDELGDKSEGTCGRTCEGYQPRNGKSGACRHYDYIYEPTDRCFTLKIVK